MRNDANFKEQRPVKSRRVETSVGPESPLRNGIARKPVEREKDPFHNRPGAFQLRQRNARQIFRMWKDGVCIRRLSWNFRVRSRDIEEIIRGEAA